VALVVLGTFFVSTKIKTLLSEAKFIASDPGVKFALLASVFWGIGFAFLSLLVKEYGWLQASVLLRISMAVWLVILMLVLKKNLYFSPERITLSLLGVVVLTDVVGYFLMGAAFKNDLASVVAPVVSVFPVITILLARIFLKEKLVLNQILGIGGILAGLVLLSV